MYPVSSIILLEFSGSEYSRKWAKTESASGLRKILGWKAILLLSTETGITFA